MSDEQDAEEETVAGEIRVGLLVDDASATPLTISLTDTDGDTTVLPSIALCLDGVEDGEPSFTTVLIPVAVWEQIDAVARQAAAELALPDDDEPDPRDLRWQVFESRLGSAIDLLDQDEYLILEAATGQFVQVAVQDGEIRVESVSKQYDAGDEVTYEDLDVLSDLGWNLPTHAAEEDDEHAEGSPNHWLDLPDDTPPDGIAHLFVQTLRLVHDADEPEDLTYRSFDGDGVRILLPVLHLSRTADDG